MTSHVTEQEAYDPLPCVVGMQNTIVNKKLAEKRCEMCSHTFARMQGSSFCSFLYRSSILGKVCEHISHLFSANFLLTVVFSIPTTHSRGSHAPKIHDQFFHQFLLISQTVVTFFEGKATKDKFFSRQYVVKFSVKVH